MWYFYDVCYQKHFIYIIANIDECAGVNCNNGTCVDGIAEYTCSCNAGFEGDACQSMCDHLK